MNAAARNLVVVGQGAAGLAAALTAAQAAPGHLRVTLIDKADEAQAGGNTLYSPSNMRMASPDRVEPSFVHDMLAATQFKGDETYFTTLAKEAPTTVAWIKLHGIEFIQPPYYLAKGPPRIQPVGGGPAVVKVMVGAAKAAGVTFRYGCAAREIVADGGKINGVATEAGETFPADAVVLACGGFQGNAAMMQTHLGAGGETMRLISPSTRYDTGDGICMALRLGADMAGDWNGMHCEPVDARSRSSAPVVLVYPYGIVVDRNGQRFFDEGGGLMHETWEWLARHIHFSTPGSIAYAILDRRLRDIADYQRAIRSEVPPAEAGSLPELAELVGIKAEGLVSTVVGFNAACTGDPAKFESSRLDGLAAPSAQPRKSNWARAISEPPFLAYPLVGAVAYTFGGIATDDRARVLRQGAPIPGLYAAGEITGHFYTTAPNAVSVLRALVFGRIAGREAARNLLQG